MRWYVETQKPDGTWPVTGTDGRTVWNGLSVLQAQARLRRLTLASGATIRAEGFYDDRPYADRPVARLRSRAGVLIADSSR